MKLRTHIVWAVSAAIELVKAEESCRSKCVEGLTEKLTKWEADYLAYANKTYSIKEVCILSSSEVNLSRQCFRFQLPFPYLLDYTAI